MTHLDKPQGDDGSTPINPIGVPTTNEMPSLDPATIAALREIRIEGEPELLGQLVELYAQEAPALMAEIRNAIEQGNSGALQAAAHSLKGSSNNLGAKRLAGLCANIENVARGGSTQVEPVALREIEREYERVCTALEQERLKAQTADT